MTKQILVQKRRLKNSDNTYYTTVDDEDFEFLSQYRWLPFKSKDQIYASANIKRGDRYKPVFMHRLLMKEPQGLVVDHKNGNGLDNTKNNLRICTPAQNNRNLPKRKTATVSKYKGVFQNKRYSSWTAKLKTNGVQHHLGNYDNEVDAAKAYDRAAIHFYGEFARPNFEDSWKDTGHFLRAKPKQGNKIKTNYRGVSLCTDKRNKPWMARINVNKKVHRLGRFETEEMAAHAFDAAAIKLLGEKAKLNFPNI